MGLCLRRICSNTPGWGGRFRPESVAAFNRNQWQPSTGIDGRFRPESVAIFDRNTQRDPWDAELPRVIAAIQGELHLLELGPPLSQQPRQSLEQRNRQAMLEKVRTYWIAGILQHSLVHEVLIVLDMTERPEAVLCSLDLLVQRSDHG